METGSSEFNIDTVVAAASELETESYEEQLEVKEEQFKQLGEKLRNHKRKLLLHNGCRALPVEAFDGDEVLVPDWMSKEQAAAQILEMPPDIPEEMRETYLVPPAVERKVKELDSYQSLLEKRHSVFEDIQAIYSEFVEAECDSDVFQTPDERIVALLAAFGKPIEYTVVAEAVGCSESRASRFTYNPEEATVEKQ